MGNILSQEETSFGVLDHDALRSSLNGLTNNKKQKIVFFRRKGATKLDNILGQYSWIYRGCKPIFIWSSEKAQLEVLEPNTRSYSKKKKQSSKISLQKRGRPLVLEVLVKKVKTISSFA